MAKLGTDKKPARFHVQTEERLQEIASICDKNGWIFIGGLEPYEPEDICEVEYLLDPKKFIIPPRMQRTDNQKIEFEDEKIGKNDPCPCGSGKKYKKCCM